MKKKMLLGQFALAAMTVLSMLVPQRASAALSFARSVTANFTAATHTVAGLPLLVNNNEQITYKVVGGAEPNVNTVVLEKACDGLNFAGLQVAVSTVNNSSGGSYTATIAVEPCASGRAWYRFRPSVYTSGTSSTTITEVDNVNQSILNNQGQSVLDFMDGGVVSNGYLKAAAQINFSSNNIINLQQSTPTAIGDSFMCVDCTPPSMVTGTATAKADQWANGAGTGVK